MQTKPKQIRKKSESKTFIPKLQQFNQHFTKLLAMSINPHSPSYGHVLMSHVERVKTVLEQTTIATLLVEEQREIQILFEFWEYLLYVCNLGVLTSTMEIIFRLLYECITMSLFNDIAILLLKEQTENKKLLTVYQKYKVLCRETYLVIVNLFTRFEKSTIGEEEINEIMAKVDDAILLEYSSKITSVISTTEYEVSVSKILASVCVVDRDILQIIDNITGSEFDPSTTICHYNAHFLLEFIGNKKVQKKPELASCTPLLLLYQTTFSFMIHFLPTWMEQLKKLRIEEKRIIRTHEYTSYKQWLYSMMGPNMRKFETLREAVFLADCIKGFLRQSDKEDLNRIISIAKSNTNIYNARQMLRMAKIIENVMKYYIEIHEGELCLFDNDFNINDFIQIIELTITAEHMESMLKLLGIIYRNLPYFIGKTRDTLLIDYLFNKRFSYFFFHWGDLVRNAFFHIILYRSMFVKQKNLIGNKLSPDDLQQYHKRTNPKYDARNQDLITYSVLLERVEMMVTMIHSIPKVGYTRDELKRYICFKEFEKVNDRFGKWLNDKSKTVSDIPKIQTSYLVESL